MSKKHPQNGPSFSRATKTAKPLTDLELARLQAWEQTQDDAARARAKEAHEARKRDREAPTSLTVR